jgi:hypothetical protein
MRASLRMRSPLRSFNASTHIERSAPAESTRAHSLSLHSGRFGERRTHGDDPPRIQPPASGCGERTTVGLARSVATDAAQTKGVPGEPSGPRRW